VALDFLLDALLDLTVDEGRFREDFWGVVAFRVSSTSCVGAEISGWNYTLELWLCIIKL